MPSKHQAKSQKELGLIHSKKNNQISHAEDRIYHLISLTNLASAFDGHPHSNLRARRHQIAGIVMEFKSDSLTTPTPQRIVESGGFSHCEYLVTCGNITIYTSSSKKSRERPEDLDGLASPHANGAPNCWWLKDERSRCHVEWLMCHFHAIKNECHKRHRVLRCFIAARRLEDAA